MKLESWSLSDIDPKAIDAAHRGRTVIGRERDRARANVLRPVCDRVKGIAAGCRGGDRIGTYCAAKQTSITNYYPTLDNKKLTNRNSAVGMAGILPELEAERVKCAGIVDPCDIWAEGIASILTAAGFVVDVSAPGPDSGLIDYPPDKVMLVARALVPVEIMRPRTDHAELPHPIVIAVLDARDELSLAEFAQSGLTGVLLRSASREAVLDCLRGVGNGQRWVDPHFAPQLALREPHRRDWCRLSHREIEVANLAAQGLSNKRIAKALNLSDGTVKTHIHHILGKLGVERRFELMAHGSAPGGAPQMG